MKLFTFLSAVLKNISISIQERTLNQTTKTGRKLVLSRLQSSNLSHDNHLNQ